ncbi:hypothetical protein N7507_002197 [Penicillium longicatenatum]|nr:hypothetical protein N7507_002197 [Penicillium longicatenatum]
MIWLEKISNSSGRLGKLEASGIFMPWTARKAYLISSVKYLSHFTRSHQVVPEFSRIVSDFWALDVESTISSKLRDKEEYEQSLCQLFDSVQILPETGVEETSSSI